MADAFLLIGLPYISVFVLVVGSIVRYRRNKFSYSALSSQFLENKKLRWGTLPWHVGILIVVAGHLVAFLLPGVWAAFTANQTFLISVEVIGLAATLLALVGLSVLTVRRLTSRWLQDVTTPMDFVLLGLLFVQVLTGMVVALQYRWGASWATGTTTPYLWSLITLQPEMGYVSEMPGLIKVHLAGAWLIFLVLPFTRLVHVFSLPLQYLFRAPQRVVWSNARRFNHATVRVRDDRRSFLKGAVGVSSAGALLSVGFFDKIARYFRGPHMTPAEEAELVATRLKRLQLTAEEKELELERMRKQFISVARLDELDPKKGKYFIDYQMRPALAFKGADGLPILISAKCTHLGCTVASECDEKGRILCPCHVSYFDIVTGAPNEGAPAKDPLPRIGWVLMDNKGHEIASEAADGTRDGNPTAEQLETALVFIAKKFEEEKA